MLKQLSNIFYKDKISNDIPRKRILLPIFDTPYTNVKRDDTFGAFMHKNMVYAELKNGGKTIYNEDQASYCNIKIEEIDMNLYAIYDGHNGPDCSRYIAEN